MLDWLIFLALRRRMWVAVSTLAVTAALLFAAGGLRIDNRWSALLPNSMPVVQEYNRIDENFLQPGNMVVVIEGPDARELEDVTLEAEQALRRHLLAPSGMTLPEIKKTKRYARNVFGHFPEDWLTEHVLRLAKPEDARRMALLLRDPDLVPFIEHLNDDLEREYTDAEGIQNREREAVSAMDAIEGLINAIGAAAQSPGGSIDEEETIRVARDLTIGRPFSFSLDNRVSLLMIAPSLPTDEFGEMPLMDREVERVLGEVGARHPEYRIERTGMIAIGRDEMDSIGPETTLISLVALVIIFVALAWNFSSAFTPLAALLPIVLGIVWTMGVIALTLGSLNLMTIMVMVVLLGLGIDFSIHITSRFREEIAAGRSVKRALNAALDGTGKGVITGGVTTAVAFLTLMVAEQRAVFEFGFCAGLGVLLTLAAVFWVLPAILAWRSQGRADKGKKAGGVRELRALVSLAGYMGKVRWVVVLAAIAVTALGIVGLFSVPWEYNFLELEPAGLRSVELQDEIVERFKLSPTSGVVVASSIAQSRKMREEFKILPAVGEVDDISMWVSRPDFHESLPHIRMLREEMAKERIVLGSFESEAGRNALIEQLDRLWANLVEIQALSFTGGQDRVVEKTRRLVASRSDRESGPLMRLVERLKALDPAEWRNLREFSAGFAEEMRGRAARMSAGEKRVTLNMVPERIRELYVSPTDQGYLVQVLPKENLFRREQLERFRDMTAKVSDRVTGTSHLILEMNSSTAQQGGKAMVAALLGIILVLLVDFRRPLVVGIATLPLIIGLAATTLILWVTGQKFNYLNMIGLPVLIGIGVDDGVHFLHRYLQEGKGSACRVAARVGRAILMTSITTMVGFGTLMLYSMRGMQSLGIVLFAGVGACFLVTVTVLPALIHILERRLIIGKRGRNG